MEKLTVAVAMSGGVDSSLTARLLLEQGYSVFGITMLLSDERRDTGDYIGDAQKVATDLGIEHYVLDLRDPFKTEIIDYFIGEYTKGRTPNPCVLCNQKIKFSRIWEKARVLGADKLATGHYARCVYSEKYGRYLIQKGKDEKKDQSYVMHRLPQELLERIIFPLGELTKDETRAKAAAFGLITAEKPESQEICFVPNDDYKALLTKLAPDAFQAGNIVNTKGEIIGKHTGIANYTIGQRKGMGIAAAEPLYVLGLDAKNNTVIAGSEAQLWKTELSLSNVVWQAYAEENLPATVECKIKIRYGKTETDGVINVTGTGTATVEFKQPVRAITPGQSAVFYDGDLLLGGGRID